MTAKEKAEELVEAMTLESRNSFRFKVTAKEHALITIDEIIKSYKNDLDDGIIDFITSPNPIDFWEEVKKEVKKS